MTQSKTAKALFLVLILALAGTIVLAGCGGSGGTTTTEQGASASEEPNAPQETEEAPAEEETEEAEEAPAEEEAEEAPEEEAAEEAGGEEGGASAAALAEGKTVFTTNCGSCHTLKEAGTSGTVGPDLDELEPDLATVEHQVINGGGPMPAFGKDGTLSPEEVKAVSTYVSSVAGE